MMNLRTFQKTMRLIRDNEVRVNQLEALLEQVNALQDKLFDEVHGEHSLHLDNVIDATQASFENLICAIEAEISAAKHDANFYRSEIANEMFFAE